MTPYTANPFIYVFSTVAIVCVILYFGYSAVDRVGIESHTAVATVSGKQFTKGGKSYYTTIAGERSWVQSHETPDIYAVLLNIGDERTTAVVSKKLYESLQANDTVQVKTRRTRITRKLEVIEVM